MVISARTPNSCPLCARKLVVDKNYFFQFWCPTGHYYHFNMDGKVNYQKFTYQDFDFEFEYNSQYVYMHSPEGTVLHVKMFELPTKNIGEFLIKKWNLCKLFI